MAINRQSLEELPLEIAKEVVSPHLNLQSLATLMQVSKSIQTLFYQPFQEASLLHFVIEANYDEAEKLVNINPTGMFEPTPLKLPNNQIEWISPLQYAFKVYDTYMWKMFLEKIGQDQLYLKRFLDQAHEQIAHLNLDPFFKAYKDYANQHEYWLENRASDQALLKAWLHIGKMQRKLLPRHMLKEFCREGSCHTWHVCSRFSVKELPRLQSCRIYNCLTKSYMPLSSHADLGTKFALTRQGEWALFTACSATIPQVLRCSGEYDMNVFQQLYKIRINDLHEQLNELKKTFDRKSAQQIN